MTAAAPPPPPPGAAAAAHLLGGRWRVQGRSARGAHVVRPDDGRVGEARLVQLPDGPERAGIAARFARETHVLVGLRHPGLPAVLDAGREGDTLWLVQAPLEGQPLDVRAPREPAEALALARGIAWALTALHDAGLLHLDLRPEHVLVAPDGTVVLDGLGRGVLAARMGRTAETLDLAAVLAAEVPAGPPRGPWDAPERAEGGSVGTAADVWSVGALLHALLVGRPPRPDDAPPTPLLQWLLSPDPEDRPADGRALLDALATAHAPAAPRAKETELGGRYVLGRPLAAGGMGTVWLARDRLEDRTVVIKRPRVDVVRLKDRALRLALEREFRILADLRHPHVVRVLDYGFDEVGAPYLVLEHLEGAAELGDAAPRRSLATRVAWLGELLRALGWLHRRGIVHHDLKPSNVLVGPTGVKVLDFGVSTAAHTGAERPRGTPPFMAPERCLGEAGDGRSDLFSFGVVLVEVLADHTPYLGDTLTELVRAVLDTPPDVSGLPAPLAALAARLLARRPEDRPQDADEVLRLLAEATGQDLPRDTHATRESALQGAPVVGREEEIEHLVEAVRAAREGHGACLRLVGEAGIGKSRLLEIAGAHARVEGFQVAQGQGVGEGGAPFHAWVPLARLLALRDDLTADERDALDRLTGRSHREGRGGAEHALDRIRIAVVDLLRRHPRPLCLLLEDLHAVGAESIALLASVAELATTAPILVVATHRPVSEGALAERPPGEGRALGPLDGAAIEALTAAMVGARGHDPALRLFLERETEGNPLYVVEAVRDVWRTLEHGERLQVDATHSGSVRRLLASRLARLTPSTLQALEAAAIFGRAFLPRRVAALHPEAAHAAWLDEAEQADVVEVDADGWRFRHDRLRDVLVEGLPPERRRALHAAAAATLEAETPEAVQALAWHWAEAGEVEHARRFAREAARAALDAGAYDEACRWLDRVGEATLTDPLDLALFHAERAIAEYGRGRNAAAVGASVACLAAARPRMPTTRLGMLLDAIWRGLVRVLRGAPEPAAVSDLRVLSRARTVQVVLGVIGSDAFARGDDMPAVWAVVAGSSLARETRLSNLILFDHASLAFLHGALGRHGAAAHELAQAEAFAEAHPEADVDGSVWDTLAYYAVAAGRWEDATRFAAHALELHRHTGDLRGADEARLALTLATAMRGDHADAQVEYRRIAASAVRRGDVEVQTWAQRGVALASVLLGRTGEAATSLALVDHVERERSNQHMIAALIHEQRGEDGPAAAAAHAALEAATTLEPSRVTAADGVGFVIEVLARTVLRGHTPDAATRRVLGRAPRALRRQSTRFPGLEPANLRRAALVALAGGQASEARRLAADAIVRADAASVPGEALRARALLAFLVEADEADRLRMEAQRLAAALRLPRDAAWRREIGEGPGAPRVG